MRAAAKCFDEKSTVKTFDTARCYDSKPVDQACHFPLETGWLLQI